MERASLRADARVAPNSTAFLDPLEKLRQIPCPPVSMDMKAPAEPGAGERKYAFDGHGGGG